MTEAHIHPCWLRLCIQILNECPLYIDALGMTMIFDCIVGSGQTWQMASHLLRSNVKAGSNIILKTLQAW